MADYDVNGPTIGFNDQTQIFTISPNGSFAANVTLDDNGAGGSFDAGSYAIDGSTSTSATATYTPASGHQGLVSISASNDGSGTDPGAQDIGIFQVANEIHGSFFSPVVIGAGSALTIVAGFSGATGSFIAFRNGDDGNVTATISEPGQKVVFSAAASDFSTSESGFLHPAQAGSWTVNFSNDGTTTLGVLGNGSITVTTPGGKPIRVGMGGGFP